MSALPSPPHSAIRTCVRPDVNTALRASDLAAALSNLARVLQELDRDQEAEAARAESCTSALGAC